MLVVCFMAEVGCEFFLRKDFVEEHAAHYKDLLSFHKLPVKEMEESLALKELAKYEKWQKKKSETPEKGKKDV